MNDELASPAAAHAGSLPQPQTATAACAPRPTLLGCLCAHWRYILRPHRAAGVLVTARGWQTALAVALALIETSAVTLIATGEPFAETWPLIVLIVLVFAWMAWVQLPQVHRAGSLRESYWRSVCACSGAVGFVIAEAVVVAVLAEMLNGVVRDAEGVDALLALLAVAMALRWFGVAVGGVPAVRMPQQPPPVCEGCGYDLTHQPADGRCPECGFEIAASLTARCPRTGVCWANDRGVRAWAAATRQTLFTPGRFYKRLRLRGGAAREHAFSRWTYRAIALGALAWIGALVACARIQYGLPPMRGVILVGSVLSLAAAVGCWVGHRTIAAGVFTWSALRYPLPDGRWAAKVITYESAFLWVFCTYWGLLATSFLAFDRWISRSLAPDAQWFLIAPAEFWVVLLGTCGLGAVWLWRYRIAYRAIRWSNF